MLAALYAVSAEKGRDAALDMTASFDGVIIFGAPFSPSNCAAAAVTAAAGAASAGMTGAVAGSLDAAAGLPACLIASALGFTRTVWGGASSGSGGSEAKGGLPTTAPEASGPGPLADCCQDWIAATTGNLYNGSATLVI